MSILGRLKAWLQSESKPKKRWKLVIAEIFSSIMLIIVGGMLGMLAAGELFLEFLEIAARDPEVVKTVLGWSEPAP